MNVSIVNFYNKIKYIEYLIPTLSLISNFTYLFKITKNHTKKYNIS